MRELNGRTLLYPRDPLSHRRLIASGIDKATASADLVFSYNLFEKVPDPVQAWIERQAAAGRRVVLLNVSGLVARKIDLSHDYAALLAHLHALDAAVLFLPHVFRSGSNDLEQCVRLFSSHGGANDLLVEDILAPAQIKTLASAAYMTVTGRMHLAIMSLSSAVPTITLATAGKVEGLYEFFDLGKLVVEPLNGVGQEICDRVGDIWTDRSAFSDRIEEALAGVRVLSSTNFGDREIAHQGNA
jgi:colanic acid/amylovoran biosynthesis protein